MVLTMTPVTDPNQIAELESSSQNNLGTPVTDPAVIAQLEGNAPQSGWQQFQQHPWPMIGNAAYDAASGAGGELGKDLYNTANFFTGNTNYLTGSKIPALDPNTFTIPNSVAGKDIGAPLGGALGFIGPQGIAGRVGEAADLVGDVLPWAKQTASNALQGAAYGGLTSPNGQRGVGTAIGAAAPLGVDLGLQAIDRGIVPTASFAKNVLTGTPNLSPEAQTMNQQVGNLPVPYALQDVYNKMLGRVPLSGVANQQATVNEAAEQQQNLATQMAQTHASNIANDLKGGETDTSIPGKIQNAVEQNHDVAKTNNDQLYQNASDKADAVGLTVPETPALSKVASQYLNNSNYAIPDSAKSMLQKYVGSTTPDVYKTDPLTSEKYVSEPATQQSFSPGSFNDAHNLQKTFAGQARSSYGNDNYLGKMYSDLSDATKDDMQSAAQNQGHPDIYNDLQNAKQDFQQNVAPYRDKSIFPIVSGTKNLNTIQNTLTANTPNANKVISDLPESTRQQIAYLKLRPGAITEEPGTGDTTVNENRLWSNFSRLDPVMKQNLLSGETRGNFSALGSMVKNPNTPLQQYITPGATKLAHNVTGGLGVLEAAAPLYTAVQHGLEPALYSALVGGLMSGGARLGAKALTNPALRNAYLSSRPGTQIPIGDQMSNLLRAGALGTALGDQQ